MGKEFDRIGRINKVICTIGEITIKHSVGVKRGNLREDVDKTYVNKYMTGKTLFPSYYINHTSDGIILERMKENKKEGVMCNVYLSYVDIAPVIRCLNEAKYWFEDEEIRNNLYVYSEDDKPYKVSEKYQYLNAQCTLTTGRFKGGFLSIQPAVVSEAVNNVLYPGVVFKCQQGVIGVCTVDEFLSLRIILISLLNNLYQESLNLINNLSLYIGGNDGGKIH